MTTFLTLIGALALAPVNAILDGWAIATIWRWFIVQAFGVPTLSMPQAIGLGLMVRYLTYRYTGKDDRETSDQIVAALAVPVLYVLLGWTVTLFL